jgi:hypothetical protein
MFCEITKERQEWRVERHSSREGDEAEEHTQAKAVGAPDEEGRALREQMQEEA